MKKSFNRLQKEMLKIASNCGIISIQSYYLKGKLIGQKELEAVEALVAAGKLEYSHVTFVNHPDTLNTEAWTKHYYTLIQVL